MYRTSRIETRIQMYSCKQVKQVLYINMYLYKRKNKYKKYIYLYKRENKYKIYIFVQEGKQIHNIYIYI